MKKALVIWGGWSGHDPKQTAGIAADLLRAEAFEHTGPGNQVLAPTTFSDQ